MHGDFCMEFLVGENVAKILGSAVGDGELLDGDCVFLSIFKEEKGGLMRGVHMCCCHSCCIIQYDGMSG